MMIFDKSYLCICGSKIKKAHEENEINMVSVTNFTQSVEVGTTVYIKIKSLYICNLHPTYKFLNLSNPDKTPAPATPLTTLTPAPRYMDLGPSSLTMARKQSRPPLYLTFSPLVIIIRLLTVSTGYAACN